MIGIDARSEDILFASGFCRSCGYPYEKHRLVYANELTTEWKICGSETLFTTSAPTQTRYICICKAEAAEYMTREEFEALYDEDAS